MPKGGEIVSDITAELFRLFVNRSDAYGEQQPTGEYTKVKSPVNEKLLKMHLDGRVTIGTYLLDHDSMVKVFCYDIDDHARTGRDCLGIAQKIKQYLKEKYNIEAYIEASGSLNSYHVWGFLQPTPASEVLKFGESVLQELGICDVEIFPKQSSVSEKGYGNLVKLPFGINRKSGNKSQFLNLNPDDLSKIEPSHLPACDDKNVKTSAQNGSSTLEQVLPKLRMCIRTAYHEKWQMNHDNGHYFRLSCAREMIFHGASDEAIHDFFKGQTDYDPKITQEKIESLKQDRKPVRCDTLRKYGGEKVKELCTSCDLKTRKERPHPETKNIVVPNGAFGYIDHIIEKTPIYYDTAHNYWMWDIEEGYYKMVDETDLLLTILREIADPSIIKSRFKQELLEAIRLRGRDIKVKDVPSYWIHVKNGVIDVKTNDVFSSSPEYLFTEPIPHNISQSEETPTIDKLFSEWVAQDKIPLLYEICAYCLYNGYPIHRMFILVGRGRNGKGQYRDIIVRLVGVKNRTASTLEQLMNSRFESARLQYKKICTMGEINYTLIERTAILKMLSGGDPIPAERKNKEPYEFVNTAKMLINTNSIPSTADKTDAWYSRCLSIEFPNQFQKGKDIIDTIPDTEYDNLLTKCVRILRELLERGEFTNEGNIQDKEREYERLSNPLTQFIQTYCEKNPDYVEAAWRVLEQYEKFCSEKGYKKPSSKTEFNLGAERAEREVPSLKSGDESEPSPSLRSNFKQ